MPHRWRPILATTALVALTLGSAACSNSAASATG
ncbi:MAG: hypothetical protein QOK26_2631, partial [Pseudonocardiales bacterium]|nr:hypothetical protein [Pseudonocardiales bacterium]